MALVFAMSGCTRNTGITDSTAAYFQDTAACPTEAESTTFYFYDEETVSEEETLKSDENLSNVHRINEQYNVNILYGDMVSWNNGSGADDPDVISSRLKALEECLSVYPPELFRDLSQLCDITINLMEDLDGADGFTRASAPDDIQIALSCDNSIVYFKLALHHELFHFIEYCINYIDIDSFGLDLTQEYTDTSLYGTALYTGTIYDRDADIYSQYFTSIYGKTSPMEDRAEIFAYYMGYTVKPCMKVSDTPISMKMKIIASAIRQLCPSLEEYPQGSLPWEEKITYQDMP